MIRVVSWFLPLVASLLAACAGGAPSSTMKELQHAKAGALDVVLLSATDALPQGRSSAVVEFRSSNGSLVDVGTVKVNATMPMAGMAPMIAGSDVKQTSVPGRYEVETEFGMAGTWRIDIHWDGPAGKGTASLAGAVQ